VLGTSEVGSRQRLQIAGYQHSISHESEMKVSTKSFNVNWSSNEAELVTSIRPGGK
jgi:hypothetical protein